MRERSTLFKISRAFGADGAGESQQTFAQNELGIEVDLPTLSLDLIDPEQPKAGKPELFSFSPDGTMGRHRSGATEVNDVYVQLFQFGRRLHILVR